MLTNFLIFENLEKNPPKLKQRVALAACVDKYVIMRLTVRGVTETKEMLQLKSILHNLTLNLSYGVPNIKIMHLDRKKKKVISTKMVERYCIASKKFFMVTNLHDLICEFLYSKAPALNSSGLRVENLRLSSNKKVSMLLRFAGTVDLIRAEFFTTPTMKEYLQNKLISSEVLTN